MRLRTAKRRKTRVLERLSALKLIALRTVQKHLESSGGSEQQQIYYCRYLLSNYFEAITAAACHRYLNLSFRRKIIFLTLSVILYYHCIKKSV